MSLCNLIIAHRGDHSGAHENTLQAFQSAIAIGADMAELDVRRTGDGELIVHHDEAIDGLLIADSDRQSVVRRSTALGFTIPSLAEVIEMTSGRISLDIELKEVGYERDVIGMIFEHHFRTDDFVITSFKAEAIRRVKIEAQGIRTGLLIKDMVWEDAVRLFREIGADYLVPEHTLLDEQTLAHATEFGVQVITWTVNDELRIRHLLSTLCLTGLVTDRPAAALGIRSDLKAGKQLFRDLRYGPEIR